MYSPRSPPKINIHSIPRKIFKTISPRLVPGDVDPKSPVSLIRQSRFNTQDTLWPELATMLRQEIKSKVS
jgi:hypothetical protein